MWEIDELTNYNNSCVQQIIRNSLRFMYSSKIAAKLHILKKLININKLNKVDYFLVSFFQLLYGISRWLLTKDRKKQAMKHLYLIASRNHKAVPSDIVPVVQVIIVLLSLVWHHLFSENRQSINYKQIKYWIYKLALLNTERTSIYFGFSIVEVAIDQEGFLSSVLSMVRKIADYSFLVFLNMLVASIWFTFNTE